jgi:hypothetical protein
MGFDIPEFTMEELVKEEPMKQTAVDWLIEQLNKSGLAQVVTEEEIKQAKKIEKIQAINDYDAGHDNGTIEQDITGEQYYNETYEK